MTNKQKFQKIDQSKITSEQKQALGVLKTKTKNFTIKDEEFNAKVSATLDNIIKKLEETNSSAIKSSGAKKSKPTAMALAKSIRKPNESWKEAQARAREMMKKDNKAVTQIVKTELDKLTEFIKNHKKLEGLSKTDVRRDASRTAKPRGARRVTHSGETSNQYGTFSNKLGRKYYESRDRHSDRLAPKYPKNAPLLEAGGYMENPNFGDFQNNVFAKGGGVTFKNGREYSLGRNWTNDHKHLNKAENHEVNYKRKRFELGGTVVTDLAGHTGGSLGTGDPTLLSGVTGTHYSGLVGETGAMSSGEMFMNGGGLPTGAQQTYIIVDSFGNPMQHLASGGSVTNERKHVNHNEDYEVRYAKKHPLKMRHGYGNIFYNNGGAVTNERKHVNHAQDYEVRYAKPRPNRKGYKGARKFMAGGMNDESPRIYVADLEAYNNGELKGQWLDLADYSDADELMAEIQNLLTYWGVEEYAIHDAEYIPSSMYSEYMGKNDFVELYKMMDLAKQHNLPLEVIEDVVNQYGEGAVDEYYGTYDSATDFAQQLVDDLGIESFNNPESYMTITHTDRRLLSQEMADSYVDDIRDEDGGNRLIEEAGLDVSEYEDADSDRQEEMLNEAREIVYDEYYNTWYDGLNDPFNFLVEEQGMYSSEDLAKSSLLMVDYDALARDLEQDYTMIEHDGSVYVFNIR